MQAYGLLGTYLLSLTLLAVPLGAYVHRVMQGAAPPLFGVLRRVEYALYRIAAIDPGADMRWSRYSVSLLLFNSIGVLFLYGLQRLQAWLPLDPGHFPAVPPHSAFNTAVSFATNTSWQSYAGETTLSHFTQMLGLTAQSFLSAATAIAVLMALARAFRRVECPTVGNAWVDVTRATLYVLLPLSVLLCLALVAQGSIQNLSPDRLVMPLQPAASAQTLPMGPVASQTAIALLGGDGGGFFNANSAHPYANPTALTNFLEMLAILLIPAALCHTFGAAVGDRRQGWTLFVAMSLLLVITSLVEFNAELAPNPQLSALGVDQLREPQQSGGNMEGKETRFGAASSALFAAVTTGGGDGAVDSAHDSYTPIGGLVPMVLMQLGEVVFGGPGSGLYGMLVYALAAVFVISLMIGRAPEYLGKKIDAFEMKMVALVVLVTPFLVLTGTAVSVLCDAGRTAVGNPGAHGFSEILYAFSSAANNNGSAFSGLSADTPYYNVATAIVMWFGRFVPIVAVMAIAGALAAKKRRAPGPGTVPTHGALFAGVLLGTVILLGALTYLPALAMGPIAEYLQQH
jgi:potassium-transporting ATPase potassium-binding subunit